MGVLGWLAALCIKKKKRERASSRQKKVGISRRKEKFVHTVLNGEKKRLCLGGHTDHM